MNLLRGYECRSNDAEGLRTSPGPGGADCPARPTTRATSPNWLAAPCGKRAPSVGSPRAPLE
eukprot:8096628-Alexandrium_andersonii.AAC.1